ncbi:MAG: ABC transporter substrate-binding protein, partial [Syntrophales bacterium]
VGIVSREVDRFSIGCILPLTGPQSHIGQSILDAVILSSGVLDENRKLPLQLVIKDLGKTDKAIPSIVERMAHQQKVIGIIAFLDGPDAVPAAREAQKWQVPMIIQTPVEKVTDEGNFIFRHYPDQKQQILTLVRYAMDTQHINSFAILYPDKPEESIQASIFREEVQHRGGKIAFIRSYKADQTDFREEIQAMIPPPVVSNSIPEQAKSETRMNVEFQGFFIPDAYPAVRMIVPQLAFYGLKGIRLLGTSGWNDRALLKNDAAYYEGAFFVDSFCVNSFNPEAADFADHFFVETGRDPGSREAMAYDTIKIIMKVLENPKIQTRDQLRQGIANTGHFHGATGGISFDEKRQSSKEVFLITIRNGQMIQVK